jgi:serine/threonine protein kinase
MPQSSLLASGVYGCVFFPAYNCNGKKTNKRQLISKLTKYDYVSKNEINISAIIKTIPNYKQYFVIIESSCPINKKNLKNSYMKHQCELLDKNVEINNNYVILYANYIQSLELNQYLENINISSNKLVKIFIDIRDRIDMLNKKKIIHNDLHFGNILVSYTGNIYIIDFGLSIYADLYYKNGELDYSYLNKVVFSYSPSWSWWTMEYHLLCYIIHNGELTEKVIRETIKEYIEQHSIIHFIYDKFSENFEKKLLDYFLKYSKMEKEETIKELLSFSPTWDYYKIALHFLKTMYVYKIENDLFKILLINLISPNPEDRPSILQQRFMVHKLIENMPIIRDSKSIDV